jgi:hypothetical protein
MNATVTSTHIDIPESLFPKICRHLLTSDFLTNASNMSGGCHGAEGKKEAWFSWVDMTDLKKHLESNDLPAVLEDFGFEVSVQISTGSIMDLMYDSKQGDEEILFEYIAEVLPGKHTVTWSGEEGAMWQWQITNKELRSVDGIITFPKPRSKKGKTK